MTTDKDGNLKIRPSVTAEEHQQVQREEKARKILLFSLLDEHMGEFYHMIDARDIWNAIKARFGGIPESKKMQKSLLKQKFEEFKIFEKEGLDKGYDKMQKILSQMNTLKIKPEPEDVNMKFLRGLPPSWSGIALILKTKGGLEYISFDDLYNKLKFLEIDTKGYSSNSSTLSNAAFVSTAGSSQGNLSYQESGNGGYGGYTTTLSASLGSSSSKGSSKSKCSIVDDVIYSFFTNHEIDQQLVYEDLDQMNKEEFKDIDWDKQTEGGNTDSRSLENFGMIARIRIESDADSEGEVVSADDVILAGVSVPAGTVAAVVVSSQSETEFALMGLSTEAAQKKQELVTKLDNEIANQAKWNNSGKNLYKLIDSSMSVRTKRGLRLDKYIRGRFASVDHTKAVPPPLTGNYMPPSNIPDIDESHMVYRKKATDSSEIKTTDDSITHTNDSVIFDLSDRSSEPPTNDLKMYDSSVECLQPNHSDHDSTSSVYAPASVSKDTIVIDCDKPEIFPSVCSIETDVKSSKPLCNKFGSFNKESHFRKHKSVASKSCYVCGIYLHLIKDYDFHEKTFAKRNAEGNGILGRRPTGKPVHPNRPKPVSAGHQNPISAGQQNTVFAGQPNPVSAREQNTVFAHPPNPVYAGQPNPVSAGQQNIVSAGLPNPIYAGQPNPVYAGDGILGPRPLNIQPTSTYIQLEKAKDRGIVDIGCSRSMSGNKDKLEDFENFDGGEVTFRGSTGKISGKGTIKTKNLNFKNVLYVEELQHFNLISVSQICDQAHRVLFTENECLVIFKDFPLPDPSMVILSIPRKHNLYTFSLNELTPNGPLTCLITKASQDESTVWHKRLGHVSFRNMNKLVKGTGQSWMFDIDYLTDSLNYFRVSSTNLTAGKEEADRLGLEFPSLNRILGVGTASIGSSISAGSTPPIFASSTPQLPTGSVGRLVFAGKPTDSAGRPVFTGKPTGSAGRHVSAGRLFVPAGRSYVPVSRILGKVTASASSERFPRASSVENSDIHDGLKIFDCPKSSIFKFSSYDDDFSGPNANNLESSFDVSSTITKRIQKFILLLKIKAIRLFLAFASFIRFMVYQMDVKSAFLYEKIAEDVYVTQPKGFVDPNHPKKVYKVVKALPDGIFIHQEKYVADILKKFDLDNSKLASTPFETQKIREKNVPDEPISVHLYRSMIGCLMYLTATRPDIMFAAYGTHEILHLIWKLSLTVIMLVRMETGNRQLVDVSFLGEGTMDSKLIARLWWFLFTSTGRVTFCQLFPIPAGDLVSAGHILFLLIILGLSLKSVSSRWSERACGHHYGTAYTVTEASIRSALQLDDLIAIDTMTNEEIFAQFWDISPTVGVAEEPLTLTSLLALFPTCLQRIATLEAKLKATKILYRDTVVLFAKRIKKLESKLKTKKRKFVLTLHDTSDSTTPSKRANQEQSSKQEISPTTLDAILTLSQSKARARAGTIIYKAIKKQQSSFGFDFMDAGIPATGLDSTGGLDSAGGLDSPGDVVSAGGADSTSGLTYAGISVAAGPSILAKPSSPIRDPAKGKAVATPSSPVTAPTDKELADQQAAILEAERQERLKQEQKKP
nr:ribonuclease H-like domain-containing protein [Tanacetum cinerariifolium]